MRRSADRFCKLTFWPTVEIEGEFSAWHSRNCNFWHDSSNLDRSGSHERPDVHFPEVLPAHSVFDEPDFSSTWDAREKALMLESSLHLHLFEVDFDPKSKWWIKTNDIEGHQIDDPCSSVHRLHGQYADAPELNPFDAVQFGPEFSSSWTTSRVPTAEVSQRDWLTKGSSLSQSPRSLLDDHRLSHEPFDMSRTAPNTHRPDATENPNLPDPPSSSESADGRDRQRPAPLRHFPAWVETLWNILQDEGATELLEEGPVIYLSTYYLSHQHCVRQAADRPIRLTRRYDEWIEEFKLIWGDIFDRDAGFEVFLVQPEPPISLTRGIVGIVLIVQHAQPGGAAILTTALFDELPTPRTLEIAHVVDVWTDYPTALRRAEAFEACQQAEQQDLRPCVLRAGTCVSKGKTHSNA